MSPSDSRVARSVLFVDFDNMGLSIKKTDETLANAFARAPQVWVEALERGELIDDDGLLAPRRRFLMKRCYANPRLIDPYRANFTWAGFQVVDCPPLTGGGKNSADIYMVMDILDALEHKTPFDEFFILSSDADFTPVLTRLTAYDRRTVIFANQVTAQAYKTMCDGLIPEPALMDLLAKTVEFARRERSRQSAPAAAYPAMPAAPPHHPAAQTVEPRPSEPATTPAETNAETEPTPTNRPRVPQIPDRVRRMARAIAEETDVPYLAPVVYAEMFKAIADEVNEKGFSLNRTVKGVHERIETANGWAIYPKYIAFVLKGIHFSGIDLTATPIDAVDLAKAFQRQVIRLANRSGLNLQADDRKNVAWWMRSALPRVATPTGVETDTDADDTLNADTTAPIDDAEPLVDARGETQDARDGAAASATDDPHDGMPSEHGETIDDGDLEVDENGDDGDQSGDEPTPAGFGADATEATMAVSDADGLELDEPDTGPSGEADDDEAEEDGPNTVGAEEEDTAPDDEDGDALAAAGDEDQNGREPVDALDAEDDEPTEDHAGEPPTPTPPRRGWWQVSPSAPVSPLATAAPFEPASPVARLTAETGLVTPVDPSATPAHPESSAEQAPLSEGDELDRILEQLRTIGLSPPAKTDGA